MKLANKNIIITGASGGIGSALAKQLSEKGARLFLSGRDQERLDETIRAINFNGTTPISFDADISHAQECRAIIEHAKIEMGDIDVLINLAGMSSFNEFLNEDLDEMELLCRVNILAPQILTHLVLPGMCKRGSGLIVNIGSMFGSIAFPYHATYSSSKFALRGFSEALRRELSGTGVSVLYVSPRATRTGFTNEEMAKASGMHLDSPDYVAKQIVAAVESNRKDCFIGFPESLFARLNGILPRLIDQGLKKQTKLMQPFASKA